MKKLIVLLIAFFGFACSSDDEQQTINLNGQIFQIVSFEVEENMDLNGDGVFSKDMFVEASSPSELMNLIIRFYDDGRVSYPIYDMPVFGVQNGVQMSSHAYISAALLDYSIRDDAIEFSHNGESVYQGVISDSNNTIVTSYTPSEFPSFSESPWSYINESGNIVVYDGNYILTLERIE